MRRKIVIYRYLIVPYPNPIFLSIEMFFLCCHPLNPYTVFPPPPPIESIPLCSCAMVVL